MTTEQIAKLEFEKHTIFNNSEKQILYKLTDSEFGTIINMFERVYRK